MYVDSKQKAATVVSLVFPVSAAAHSHLPLFLQFHGHKVDTMQLCYKYCKCYVGVTSVIHVGESVALMVARRTNNREVASSKPTTVVCITVLTGNRLGRNCLLWPAGTPSSEL